jgi:hypothetical protein
MSNWLSNDSTSTSVRVPSPSFRAMSRQRLARSDVAHGSRKDCKGQQLPSSRRLSIFAAVIKSNAPIASATSRQTRRLQCKTRAGDARRRRCGSKQIADTLERVATFVCCSLPHNARSRAATSARRPSRPFCKPRRHTCSGTSASWRPRMPSRASRSVSASAVGFCWRNCSMICGSSSKPRNVSRLLVQKCFDVGNGQPVLHDGEEHVAATARAVEIDGLDQRFPARLVLLAMIVCRRARMSSAVG